MQFYVENNQEIFDTIIQAYKICENSSVLLPAMVCFEGFVLSHTSMPFTIPDQEKLDCFLPRYKPGWKLDVKNPMAHGTLCSSDYFTELRYLIQEAMENARQLIPAVDKEYSEKFGLPYHGGLLEAVSCDDAEIIVVSMGTIGSDARVAVQKLREKEATTATALRDGVKKEVMIATKKIAPNDLVMVHAGIVIGKLSLKDFLANVSLYRDILTQNFLDSGLNETDARKFWGFLDEFLKFRFRPVILLKTNQAGCQVHTAPH
jgi:hydrogenase maturation factor